MYDLVLIDVSSWVHRAYHAFPALTAKDGRPTGALTGAVNTLFGQIKNGALKDATHAIAVFDAGGTTFRHRIQPAYKAQRKRRDDLFPQMAYMMEAFEAFGIHYVAAPDVEADDVIAHYAHVGADWEDEIGGMKVAILSTDKDLTQLVGPDVVMFDSMGDYRGRITDEAAVKLRWGVPPSKMASLLALAGDATDGVRGVPGIGPKTAAELLAPWRDLEDLLANVGSVANPRHRDLLTEHAATARAAHRMILLPSPDAPPPVLLAIEHATFSAGAIDVDRVLAFAAKFDLESFANTIKAAWTVPVFPGMEVA